MKKVSFCTILLGVFVVSCNKDLGKTDLITSSNPPIIKQAASITGVAPVFITLATNGEYISTYGVGITFSSSFPHTTVVDNSGLTDGEPVISYPSVTFVGVPTLSSTIDGNKFDIIEPTFPNAVTITQVSNYFNALHKYWDDTTGTISRPAPLGSSSGAGGIIEIKGAVVRDHNSPTNTSVVPDTYVYVTNPILLCGLTKSGYSFKFYGTLSDNGMVLKITGVNSSNTPVTITSYSVQYSLINSGNDYQLVGYLKLSNGTQISINDITFSLR